MVHKGIDACVVQCAGKLGAIARYHTDVVDNDVVYQPASVLELQPVIKTGRVLPGRVENVGIYLRVIGALDRLLNEHDGLDEIALDPCDIRNLEQMREQLDEILALLLG